MISVLGYDGAGLSSLALQRLSAADLVVGGERHLAAVTVPAGAATVLMGDFTAAMAAIATAHRAGDNVVALTSGDPGFFGLVRRLTTLADVTFEVLPAVSSVATAFARLGLPWDDAVVVSAHGRPVGPAVAALLRFPKVAVLTDSRSTPAVLARALGAHCPELVVLERLGETDERITRITSAEQAAQQEWRQPLVVLRADSDAPTEVRWLAGFAPATGWALPESAFEHRDGLITKREVRALALAHLAPAVGRLLWDVGSGSGAVAVECSRLGAAVIAIERDADGCARITANAEAHRAPVQVVHGRAPDALADLPQPDAVFVGGGGHASVLAVAARRPQRVVVALATLERVEPTLAALADYDTDTVLLQAQRLQSLGEGNRLVPTNPVFLVSGVLR